ncbi:MAG TPA: AAA family ATPase [Haliangium sp.]|nr:AAA family ATPase [Haliangium sp.]
MSENPPSDSVGPAEPIGLPIGIDDFRALREQGLTYVDKTHLICELIDRAGAQVVLLPRPRRFGKSLALSTLRYFFDRQGDDLGHLFDDLAVWRAGERYRAHFRRYPVIHLGFKDLERERWDDLQWAMREKIRDLFDEHRAVLDAGAPGALERERFDSILDGSAPPGLYQRALRDLTRALHRAHGEKVVLLIDDCDLPVHAGHAHGYGREVLAFFRGLFTAGLEGNPHLARAVLTGVTGTVRESVFSGPSNVATYTLLRSEFSTCFGFTESEVDTLLARSGQQAEQTAPDTRATPGARDPRDERAMDERAMIDRWYGGYRFGQHTIYNPASVLSFLADPRARARPYWLQNGSRDLAYHVLAREISGQGPGEAAGQNADTSADETRGLRPLLEALLAGEPVACALGESVALDRLEHSRDALWSLLVFCGWLRAVERPPGARAASELPVHALSIPNREVDLLLRSLLAEQPAIAPARPVPAAAHPHEAGPREVPIQAQSREDIEPGPDDGPDDDLLQQRRAHVAGMARRERDQARPLPERRPDIVADAAAFEERLQRFFEEMRANPDTRSSTAPADDGAAPGADEPAAAGRTSG